MRTAVLDESSVLMEEEADWLEGIAEELSEQSGWEIAAVTCSGVSDEDAETVCEEYFTANASGEDGISCIVDTADKEVYFSAEGEAEAYFEEGRIDAVIEEAKEAAFQEDYAQSLYLMLLRAGEAYEAGPQPEQAGGKGIPVFGGIILVLLIVCALFWALRRALRRLRSGSGRNS